ncbi:MAG TPA: TonB-dependent receptor [Candidatus Dormibacteraeota bacterium]|nr:TonB-dependent receptor [Candidatus Dormibacteraeota bacterium]
MSNLSSRFKRIGIAGLGVLILLCGLSSSAFAQGGTGTITGTVTDPRGLTVPQAAVEIMNSDTGIARPLTTTDTGNYTATFLQPGHYQVTISKDGFQTYVRKNLLLQVGQTLTINTKLVVGTTVSQIVVTGEAPLIDTERTDSSQTVSQTQVEGLPIAARRWQSFALLTPAVTTDGSSGLTSYRGISSLYNNNSVDGANNTQAFFSEARGRAIIVAYVYSPDSIKEFQVSASNYSAEFGQAAGGVVNAITKSGTNTLHGDLFWNFRYPTLNALDPQTKANTVNQQNQFGGSIGTPIIKDKLFFFGTYDGFRKVNPITYASTELGGSLSDITSTLNGYTCPATLASPTICTAAKNFITTDVLGSFPRSLKQDVFFGKLDYQFTPTNHVSAVFNWQNWGEPNGYDTRPTVFNGGLSQNGSGGTHERFFIVNWNSTISSNKVNEFRFQWGRDFEFDSTNSPGPSVSLSNMFSYGEFIALPRGAFPDEHRLQFSDNYSIVKGSHLIKMGVDVNFIHELLVNLFQGDGNYSYSNSGIAFDGCPSGGNSLFCQWVDDAVGVNVGDSLTGQHWSSFTQVNDPITNVGKDDFYDNDFAAYLQDTWKIRPNVTLNLGVRYDLQHVPPPGQANTGSPLLTLYTSTLNVDKNNFAPRLGIAWQINNKTVVHAGYGMFYGKTSNSTYYALRVENGVYQQTFSGCNPTSSNPTLQACAPTFPNVFFTPPGPAVAAPFTGALTPTVGIPGGTLPGNSSAAHGMVPDFVNPVAHEAELTIERELPWGMSASAAYLMTRGLHLPASYDSNVDPASKVNVTYDVLDSSGNTVTTSTVPFYTSRLDSGTGAILTQASIINSWYNGLVLTLRKPMRHDVEFVVNYTFSKALDNGQTAGSNGTFFGTDAVLDPYNFKQDYALSDLDQRHRVVGSFVWQPHYGQNFSNAVARQLAEGWTASAIVTYATGHPYPANISTSYITPTDPTNSSAVLRPLGGDGGMTGAELSTYAGPTGGRAAWLVRNPSTLPSITTVDFRMGRAITFHEKYSLIFTADAFNLFNSTLVSSVSTNAFSYTAAGSGVCTGHTNGCFSPTASYGGSPTTSGTLYGARQLQFGARFEF